MLDDLDATRITRVVLADDHDILRQGLKLLLGSPYFFGEYIR